MSVRGSFLNLRASRVAKAIESSLLERDSTVVRWVPVCEEECNTNEIVQPKKGNIPHMMCRATTISKQPYKKSNVKAAVMLGSSIRWCLLRSFKSVGGAAKWTADPASSPEAARMMTSNSWNSEVMIIRVQKKHDSIPAVVAKDILSVRLPVLSLREGWVWACEPARVGLL